MTHDHKKKKLKTNQTRTKKITHRLIKKSQEHITHGQEHTDKVLEQTERSPLTLHDSPVVNKLTVGN